MLGGGHGKKNGQIVGHINSEPRLQQEQQRAVEDSIQAQKANAQRQEILQRDRQLLDSEKAHSAEEHEVREEWH